MTIVFGHMVLLKLGAILRFPKYDRVYDQNILRLNVFGRQHQCKKEHTS